MPSLFMGDVLYLCSFSQVQYIQRMEIVLFGGVGSLIRNLLLWGNQAAPQLLLSV